MGTFATYTDVQARIPGRTIGASTYPNTTQVGDWIDEAEAMLTGALQAGQCTVPTSSTSVGGKILKAWVTDYAEGLTRMAHAAAGGDGGNDDGKAQVDRFYVALNSIMDTQNASKYDAMLNGGGASESTSHVRSHIKNNSDGLTVEDGDFDPIFEMDEAF